MSAQVIAFPRQLRVVPVNAESSSVRSVVGKPNPAVIKQEDQLFDLAALVRRLSGDERDKIASTIPDLPRSFGTRWYAAGPHWLPKL